MSYHKTAVKCDHYKLDDKLYNFQCVLPHWNPINYVIWPKVWGQKDFFKRNE